jgi:hypothetical protein
VRVKRSPQHHAAAHSPVYEASDPSRHYFSETYGRALWASTRKTMFEAARCSA